MGRLTIKCNTLRPAARRCLWAVLIARVYEMSPLLCTNCGGQMRTIALITHSTNIRQILNHIGVEFCPAHKPSTWAVVAGGGL